MTLNCQLMLNKLDFSIISPRRRSKSTTDDTQYMFISLFLFDVNGLFSFHLVFYESDIHASKWFKKNDKCMRRAKTLPPQQA